MSVPKKAVVEVQNEPKQNWEQATQQDKFRYKCDLNIALQEIKPEESCLQCVDLNCSKLDHKEALDDYIIQILEAIETCTKNNIPYRNPTSKIKGAASIINHVPGWNEHVKPFKEEANFWYVEWRKVGKPRTGLLYQNMRFFRSKFRYEKRRCLNAAEVLKRDKFLESCLEGDKPLFEELKRFKGVPNNIA